jgi:hypothetical protein
MDKVFGAPATRTADAFLETLSIALLFVGLIAVWFARKTKKGGLL